MTLDPSGSFTPASGRLRSLYERLTTPAGPGVIIGTFDHDCQDEDIIDNGSSQECRVCGCFVIDPSG